jgi:hypothetical protein
VRPVRRWRRASIDTCCESGGCGYCHTHFAAAAAIQSELSSCKPNGDDPRRLPKCQLNPKCHWPYMPGIVIFIGVLHAYTPCATSVSYFRSHIRCLRALSYFRFSLRTFPCCSSDILSVYHSISYFSEYFFFYCVGSSAGRCRRDRAIPLRAARKRLDAPPSTSRGSSTIKLEGSTGAQWTVDCCRSCHRWRANLAEGGLDEIYLVRHQCQRRQQRERKDWGWHQGGFSEEHL